MTAPAILSEIRRGLDTLLEPGTVAEVRILGTRSGTVSGYFDDGEKLAAAIGEWDGKAPGIYVTLNPVHPDLLARAVNRLVPYAKLTTSDSDILRRRWLGFDFDPVRPTGISATEHQHAAALDRAHAVRDWLAGAGWPDGVLGDSGNGGHLLHRVELPNDPEALALVTRALEAVAFLFSDEAVKVDVGVANAARIWKIPGTMACKGDATADRPHRRSRLLEVPSALVAVPQDLLEAVVAMAPRETRPPSRNGSAPQGFDLQRWIADHRLPVVTAGAWNGAGRKWVLASCPWNPDHTNRAAFIVQHASGAIAAGCHHNGCAGNDWKALRTLLEPGWREARPATRTRRDKETVTPVLVEGEHLTDLGNAKRFVARHGQDLRYCHPWGKWLVWDGARFAPDETGEVERRAKETVRALYQEAGELVDEKARAALAGHALKSESERRIAAMIALATSEPGIPVTPAQFDADPWLLTTKTHTINLRTGGGYAPRREDLITKLAPVACDPTAACPMWLAFLQRVLAGNARLIGFLQRLVGYALTGVTVEQVLAVFYGLGANGKSTLLRTLMGLLGDYAMQTPTDTLLLKQDGGISNDVARLRGARFVAAVETEGGRRLAEVLVKQLTGGDTMTARFLYHEHFEFTPTFKLFLGVNHKPIIKGTDHAIWRRIRLVPFTVRIPEAEQDKGLLEKLRAEGPGILRWAVEGCLAWQRDGLGTPEEVRQATADYRDEMDVLAPFFEKYIEVDAASDVEAAGLYKAYLQWCEAVKEPRPMSQRALCPVLEERGFRRERGTGGVRLWVGLRLKAEV